MSNTTTDSKLLPNDIQTDTPSDNIPTTPLQDDSSTD
jgi:hypothetical protein